MSKNVGISALGMIAVAGTASAVELQSGPKTNLLTADQYTLTAQPLSAIGNNRGPADIRYDAINGNAPPYFLDTGTGFVGFDDYQTDNFGSTATVDLAFHRFIGGLLSSTSTTVGVLWFNFYTAGGTFFDSYGVNLIGNVGGIFYYTITITTPFPIPTDGLIAMEADSSFSTTSGGWYGQGGAPAVGTQDPGAYGYQYTTLITSFQTLTTGGGTTTVFNTYFSGSLTYMHQIEEVPAPAGLALLGLGGALAGRRRR